MKRILAAPVFLEHESNESNEFLHNSSKKQSHGIRVICEIRCRKKGGKLELLTIGIDVALVGGDDGAEQWWRTVERVFQVVGDARSRKLHDGLLLGPQADEFQSWRGGGTDLRLLLLVHGVGHQALVVGAKGLHVDPYRTV